MTASRRSLPVRISPRPLRTLGRRIARSRARDDAARYLRDQWPFLVGCLLVVLCALAVALATRGMVVTWGGVYELPTVEVGTDAGMVVDPAA